MRLKSWIGSLAVLYTCSFATCNRIHNSNKDAPAFGVFQDQVPVLKGKPDNQVIRIQIPASGNIAQRLTVVNISLKGTTNIKDIKALRLYYTGIATGFRNRNLFASATPATGIITLFGSLELKPGNNNLWLSVELDEQASLEHRIDAVVNSIVVNGKQLTRSTDFAGISQRIGIALRKSGDDKVNTYRIPGIVTTKAGTLISVYDIRYDNSADLQGDIDVGMSRSTDGGKTWEPMQRIMDPGTWGNKPQSQNGIGDPSVLVDRQTGTIWVAALWLHGYPGQRAWTASKPGLSPDKTGQVMLTRSSDDGKTWSPLINITEQVKNPGWQLCFQGPGTGITMQDGTLVFPAQFKDSTQLPHATIMYSRDKGLTWHMATAAYPNTTEAQVTELEPGTLMLNMRDNRGGSRTIYTTRDLGKTWTEHPSSRSALIEPVCNAALLRHEYKGQTVLFFVNPNDTSGRNHMTIKASMDMGLTWPLSQQLLVDELMGNGYPTLTAIDEDHLGLLYESSQANLVFERINIREILRK